MATKKVKKEKPKLHLRNKNREQYDLKAMTLASPELSDHIQPNRLGADSINFSDPVAVKSLNRAILKHYYGIAYWEFPDENLCPPIPGRADYIHHVADLLRADNFGNIPTDKKVTCIDIGVGASCIYPIIGVVEYQWNFIGTDIDGKSISSAQNIVNSNPNLKGKVICCVQSHPKSVFRGIIQKADKIDVTICNPPFHASIEDAIKGTRRKVKNLTGHKENTPKLNFSGNHNELVCQGGEAQFISNMITESAQFAKQCFWFTTLVSKESNLKRTYKALSKHKPEEIRTINTKAGNKSSRIVAWTYLTANERKTWRSDKWNKKLPKKKA